MIWHLLKDMNIPIGSIIFGFHNRYAVCFFRMALGKKSKKFFDIGTFFDKGYSLIGANHASRSRAGVVPLRCRFLSLFSSNPTTCLT